MRISKSQAQRIGNRLKVNWNSVNLDQLLKGIEVESEHKNVVGNSMTAWAKIALAHLAESPVYYTRLKTMESKFK